MRNLIENVGRTDSIKGYRFSTVKIQTQQRKQLFLPSFPNSYSTVNSSFLFSLLVAYTAQVPYFRSMSSQLALRKIFQHSKVLKSVTTLERNAPTTRATLSTKPLTSARSSPRDDIWRARTKRTAIICCPTKRRISRSSASRTRGNECWDKLKEEINCGQGGDRTYDSEGWRFV